MLSRGALSDPVRACASSGRRTRWPSASLNRPATCTYAWWVERVRTLLDLCRRAARHVVGVDPTLDVSGPQDLTPTAGRRVLARVRTGRVLVIEDNVGYGSTVTACRVLVVCDVVDFPGPRPNYHHTLQTSLIRRCRPGTLRTVVGQPSPPWSARDLGPSRRSVVERALCETPQAFIPTRSPR